MDGQILNPQVTFQSHTPGKKKRFFARLRRAKSLYIRAKTEKITCGEATPSLQSPTHFDPQHTTTPNSLPPPTDSNPRLTATPNSLQTLTHSNPQLTSTPNSLQPPTHSNRRRRRKFWFFGLQFPIETFNSQNFLAAEGGRKF